MGRVIVRNGEETGGVIVKRKGRRGDAVMVGEISWVF